MGTRDKDETKLCQMLICGTHFLGSQLSRKNEGEKLLVDPELCRLRRKGCTLALGKQHRQNLNDRIWPFGIYRNSS